MQGPGRHLRETYFLSAQWPPCPWRGRPSACVPGLGSPVGRGGDRGRVSLGAGRWERLLQANAPFISPQPLPFLVPGVAAASGPCSPAPLLCATLVSVPGTGGGEGCNDTHLLKAYVSSLGQVASCPWALFHWLCIRLQIRRKAPSLQPQPPPLAHAGCRALAGSRGLG